MKKFIYNELSGWKAWEVTWLLVACGIITILSILQTTSLYSG